MIKKVFGIISYFPDNDSDYHIETRRERSRRFRELLFKLEELWPDVDIMVIAQNWQDFELPEIKNKIITFHYDRLGILGARRELRKRFLASPYDYLIMLDDDARVDAENPDEYMSIIDQHPDGFGTLRKRGAPLNLCAVSKFVYSQVDMPDIDPENSEGFEDNIFVAMCFNKFPDRSYIFPEGVASETSFRYEGPGKCPSTWAQEKKYNWSHMRKHTEDMMHQLYHPESCEAEPPEAPEPDKNASIDLLITYVNCSDRNWVQDYIKTTKTHNPSKIRYRSWGTLKYLLRGVERYMPFIRNVVLIVSRASQVPAWINKENVRIVYHEDFIPKKYLPTFNSCAIESFFWNIPDLADRVIYFNDDMFPINPLSENVFFTGNKPNIKFTEPKSYSTRAIYQSQCRSGIDLITNALSIAPFESGKIFRPYHISMAITKDSMAKVAELCKDTLPQTISTVRSTKNVNQYIYAYYQYFTDNYVDKIVRYKYYEFTDANLPEILDEILNNNYQMLCLNDSDKIRDYAATRAKLLAVFACKFPKPSRYELI